MPAAQDYLYQVRTMKGRPGAGRTPVMIAVVALSFCQELGKHTQ